MVEANQNLPEAAHQALMIEAAHGKYVVKLGRVFPLSRHGF